LPGARLASHPAFITRVLTRRSRTRASYAFGVAAVTAVAASALRARLGTWRLVRARVAPPAAPAVDAAPGERELDPLLSQA
jgi:hypothetical protein